MSVCALSARETTRSTNTKHTFGRSRATACSRSTSGDTRSTQRTASRRGRGPRRRPWSLHLPAYASRPARRLRRGSAT
eukprot:4652422-Prymnesium_polylepis.1